MQDIHCSKCQKPALTDRQSWQAVAETLPVQPCAEAQPPHHAAGTTCKRKLYDTTMQTPRYIRYNIELVYATNTVGL